MDWLYKIIDEVFLKMQQEEFGMKTVNHHFPKEMIDNSIATQNDWIGWKPIISSITDKELDELEERINNKLPKSYREFLKYKYFKEFTLEDFGVGFPSHLPNKTIDDTLERIEMFEDEFMPNGFIYFADFSDWGFLCFDTNQTREDNEYPIIMIDQEDTETVHLYAQNFKDLLESDAERSNGFIGYLNEFNKTR